MKNYRQYFSFLVFTLFICIFSSPLPAQYETEEEKQGDARAAGGDYGESKKESKGEPVEAGNKLCPVTLTKITAGDTFTYTYEGKAYRFSSSQAIEEFKKEPEKYLKEWEKKEKFYKVNIIYD